ncbi:Ig-like domain repeat protein [Terriglobus albidus]|uniref:Ig-like domain repeat protein n=1 Tax=Terriglobus albidus TaxID=1592106 RepID=UPI0021DFEACB|nr:Ig-like domain repeat protein [Terriglobus albidus]
MCAFLPVLAASLLAAVPSAAQVFQFPSAVAVGTGSSTQTVTVPVTTGGSLGSITVGTQGLSGYDFSFVSGGSCTIGNSYVPTQSCTVSVQFAPQSPGLRSGGIVLKSGSGTVMGWVLLSGTGSGPLVGWLPGTMSTVVGNGTWIYGGDGMPATQSTLFLPQGVVVDAAGNLYVTDSSSNRVRRIDAQTQIITTIAGNGDPGYTGDGGPATGASLSNPTGLALDGLGNLYIADNYNHVVRAVDLGTNIIRTVAGTGTAGHSGDGGAATSAHLNGPNGLAVDPAAGILYIADTGNSAVRKLDLVTGTINAFAGTGVAGYSGDGGTAISAKLNLPWGIAVAADGHVCIADQGNHMVRCVTSGVIQLVAGTGVPGFSGDGSAASSAQLRYPGALLFDVAGNLLISDTSNNRVRRINAVSGLIETITGTGGQSFQGDDGPANAAMVYGPYSMALDGYGNLYIADMFHNRVRKITTNLAKMTFAAIRVGRTSPTQTITVENAGNTTMTITNVATVSNASLDGNVSGMCGTNTVLASSTNCVVGAQFNPQVIGNPVNGRIEVQSAAINAPAVLLLSGEVLTLDPTTVNLSSSPNPSALAQAVTLTAQVQTSGTNVPTGKVTFYDGSTPLGSPVNLASGAATLVTSTLALGSHSLTASYEGDQYNNPSTSTAVTQVVKQAATVNLASSNTTTVIKQPVTFTATVTAAGSPTGSITFQDGSSNLGTIGINGSGVAQITVNTLSVGTHSITATYSGDTNTINAVSNVVTQTVQKDTSLTTLGAAPSSIKAGEPLTLTATVSNSGLVAVTGSVTFKDGSNILGTANLNGSGIATWTATGLNGGAHSFTAAYGGDTNNSTSTSTALNFTVDTIPTTTLLSASASTVDAGAQLQLSATVTPSQTTGGQVTGTVTFYDGSTVLGTTTVPSNGVAQLVTTSLSVGSHTLTATYSGSTNYATSTSNIAAVTVRQATTSTVITSSGSPAIAGSVVTFSITVTGSGGIPAGTVGVKDNGTPIGLVTLNGAGKASFAISTLSVGTHVITADYAGDAKNTASSSTPISQEIVQATTTLRVAASANPSVSGQPVSLVATATSNGGVPPGQVQFLDGGVLIGASILNGSGVASLPTSSLTPGIHTITAIYAGDATYAAATSNALSLTVLQAITVAVASGNNPSIAGRGVQFTATVSGGSNLTGTVAFKDGSTSLGTASLQNGVAIFSTANLAVGTHSITAIYSGDSTNASASSPVLLQQIISATTTVQANPSTTTLIYGSALTVQVQVTGNGGDVTGQVTLLDGTTSVATATLGTNGTATLITSSLTIGPHTLIVHYAGDAKNTAADSSPIQLLVRQNSQVALVSSLNPALTGENVVLTAKVTNVDGKPTGSVTFLDGGSLLGQATLDANGNASISSATLVGGKHVITAQYSGDTLNLSSSATLTQEMDLRPTTTGLSVSATSLQTGQTVSLVAVVRGTGPAMPTGAVLFTSGTTTLGTAAVDTNGLATLTVSPSAATYHVVATYSGDFLYAGSASSSVDVVVSQAQQFTLALSPSKVNLTSGDHVTVTLSIASLNGFADTLNLGCNGLPFAATCTFSPNSLKLGANITQQVQLQIDTGNPLGAGASASVRNTDTPILATILWPGVTVLGLLGMGMRKRRRWLGGLLMALAMIGVAGGTTGCTGALHTNTTPAGSYTFQVTGVGTTSGAKQAIDVTLTVGQ